MNNYDINRLKHTYICTNQRNCLIRDEDYKKYQSKIDYKKGITIHFIVENMYYEGGYSNDPKDIGNYYQGVFFGTKYGLSAAFLVPYKKLSKDSIMNMRKEDAVCIMMEYLFKDYFINFSDMFIFYYVLFAFYYSKELADYFICVRYNLEPNAYNAKFIYNNIPMTNEDALYLKKCFEARLSISKESRPEYAKSWDRKYMGLLERNSHLFID